MFAHLTLFAFAVTLLSGAIAIPTPSEPPKALGRCNGGELQCCFKAQDPHSLDWEARMIASLVKADVGSASGLVGTHCTGINSLAVDSGSECTLQKVCCSNNSFNGLVAMGCTPIEVASS
ncbi:fungal hydrophobin-domain-containing protein [Coprinopsis sp. MPI-PUGE-AT-0042]|nr:fungal hydrophobin-domain-containing protein [Coprinopsis sp. MPI-PUGE-AT-0042]